MGTPHERQTQPQPGTRAAKTLAAMEELKPTTVIAWELDSSLDTAQALVAYVQRKGYDTTLSTQQRAIRRAEGQSMGRNETWVTIKPFALHGQSASEIQQSVLLKNGDFIPINNIHQSLKRARKEPRAELQPLTDEQRVKNLQDGHKTPEQLWQQVVPGLPNLPKLHEEFAGILAQSGQEMPSDQTDQLRMFVYFLACKHWVKGKNALLTKFAKEVDNFTPEEETRLLPPMLATARGIRQAAA